MVFTGDRGVHRQRPVDHPGGIWRGSDCREHLVLGVIRGHSAMPGPDRLPRPEYHSQIPPRNAGPIALDNALDP